MDDTQHLVVGALRPDQVQLLDSLLRAAGVEADYDGDTLTVGAHHRTEVERAVAWVRGGSGLDVADDHQPTRPPLVAPSRPPLADGRRQATRQRRLAAGMVDEVLLSIPVLLAASAGAPWWTTTALHAGYHVVPTVWFGWSIGKLVAGLRTVSERTLRSPDVGAAVARWAVAFAPIGVATAFSLSEGWRTLALAVVLAPIMVDLRGLHDRVARTRVVERTPAGPGVWPGGLSARRRDRPRTPVSRRL